MHEWKVGARLEKRKKTKEEEEEAVERRRDGEFLCSQRCRGWEVDP